MPYLRPMVTVIHDSINYGIDEDGGSIHDVIGTRCDPYTFRAMTGRVKVSYNYIDRIFGPNPLCGLGLRSFANCLIKMQFIRNFISKIRHF